MGTSMENIQNAYSGFARGSYVMLDNLKLGYSGTKTEMERLLADATKLTGVKYDISNLSDVYSAIHAIQENLDITGTTAKEAAETFSGSFGAMKAAAEDFMGRLSLGMDIGPSLNALAETMGTFVFDNLIPMVGNIIKALPQVITTFLSAATPMLVEGGKNLLKSVVDGINLVFPELNLSFDKIWQGIQTAFQNIIDIAAPILQVAIDTIKNYITIFKEFWTGVFEGDNGIGNSFSKVFKKIIDIAVPILQDAFVFIQDILNQLKTFWQENGTQIVQAVKTAYEFISNIITTVLEFLQPFIQASWENIKMIFQAALDIILDIVKAVTSAINGDWSGFFDAIKGIASSVWEGIKGIFSNSLETIKGVVSNVMGAVKDVFNNMMEQAKGFVSSKVDSIKNLFHSLGSIDLWSIGQNIIQGLINGISSMIGRVTDIVSNIAGKITGGLKGLLGIHSPSRVMRDQVGKFIPEGLAEGIENSSGYVLGALSDLSNDMVNGLDTELDINAVGSLSKINDLMNLQSINSKKFNANDLVKTINNQPIIHMTVNWKGKEDIRRTMEEIGWLTNIDGRGLGNA